MFVKWQKERKSGYRRHVYWEETRQKQVEENSMKRKKEMEKERCKMLFAGRT